MKYLNNKRIWCSTATNVNIPPKISIVGTCFDCNSHSAPFSPPCLLEGEKWAAHVAPCRRKGELHPFIGWSYNTHAPNGDAHSLPLPLGPQTFPRAPYSKYFHHPLYGPCTQRQLFHSIQPKSINEVGASKKKKSCIRLS